MRCLYPTPCSQWKVLPFRPVLWPAGAFWSYSVSPRCSPPQKDLTGVLFLWRQGKKKSLTSVQDKGAFKSVGQRPTSGWTPHHLIHPSSSLSQLIPVRQDAAPWEKEAEQMVPDLQAPLFLLMCFVLS